MAIRGRILAGKVKSTKMNRTIVVRRDYLHYIKKYQRWVAGAGYECVWCVVVVVKAPFLFFPGYAFCEGAVMESRHSGAVKESRHSGRERGTEVDGVWGRAEEGGGAWDRGWRSVQDRC